MTEVGLDLFSLDLMDKTDFACSGRTRRAVNVILCLSSAWIGRRENPGVHWKRGACVLTEQSEQQTQMIFMWSSSITLKLTRCRVSDESAAARKRIKSNETKQNKNCCALLHHDVDDLISIFSTLKSRTFYTFTDRFFCLSELTFIQNTSFTVRYSTITTEKQGFCNSTSQYRYLGFLINHVNLGMCTWDANKLIPNCRSNKILRLFISFVARWPPLFTTLVVSSSLFRWIYNNEMHIAQESVGAYIFRAFPFGCCSNQQLPQKHKSHNKIFH